MDPRRRDIAELERFCSLDATENKMLGVIKQNIQDLPMEQPAPKNHRS